MNVAQWMELARELAHDDPLAAAALHLVRPSPPRVVKQYLAAHDITAPESGTGARGLATLTHRKLWLPSLMWQQRSSIGDWAYEPPGWWTDTPDAEGWRAIYGFCDRFYAWIELLYPVGDDLRELTEAFRAYGGDHAWGIKALDEFFEGAGAGLRFKNHGGGVLSFQWEGARPWTMAIQSVEYDFYGLWDPSAVPDEEGSYAAWAAGATDDQVEWVRDLHLRYQSRLRPQAPWGHDFRIAVRGGLHDVTAGKTHIDGFQPPVWESIYDYDEFDFIAIVGVYSIPEITGMQSRPLGDS